MIARIKKIFKSATKNTFRRILMIIIIVFPVYNLILLNFQHEFRISVNRVIENDNREFFKKKPELTGETIRWEDRSMIKGFVYPLPDSIVQDERSLQKVMDIMTVIRKTLFRKTTC